MNAIGIVDSRPPYLRFDQRAVEDRAQTIAKGHYIAKDVDFVIVHQIGSVNTVEKAALEWLKDQDELAQNGRIPREWPIKFRELYNQYKAGFEPVREGVSVRSWPAISKAQAENLVRSHVLTVEDLAAAPEAALEKIGMGARELQQKARAWLESADRNKSAEELTALRAEIANKDVRIKALEGAIEALAHKVESLGGVAVTAEGSPDEDEAPAPRRGRRAA